MLSRELPDTLAHLGELKDFELYAGDGHFHAASAHDAPLDGKKHSTGHFFALNLRNHALSHLTHAQGKKEHDLHALKRLEPDFLRQGAPKGRKVIYVWDRAGIDLRAWNQWKHGHGIYFLSREKKNMQLEVLGENHFDRSDPRNQGVLRDELVGTSQGVTVRRVVYQDPESGKTYSYLTNLSQKVPPGIVAFLYKCRWDIEKAFDELKNKLQEQKAWDKSAAAKSFQANTNTVGKHMDSNLLEPL